MRVGIAFALSALLCACASMTRVQHELPWSTAQQLVLVITPDWNSSRGVLRTYVRGARDWRSTGASVPVVVGRNGAAWGLGTVADCHYSEKT